MPLTRFISHNRPRSRGLFAILLSGGLMMGCTVQAASFSCEMPASVEAVTLCAAVEAALSTALGAPLERTATGADYVLVIEEARPVRIVAHLDAFGKIGPRLGLSVSDAPSVPTADMAKLASNLVASLK